MCELLGWDDPYVRAVKEGFARLRVREAVGALSARGVAKVDGAAGGQTRPAPALNEHARELLGRT